MTATAVVTMIAICGVVWGGFALLLARAIGREARKTRDAGDGDAGNS